MQRMHLFCTLRVILKGARPQACSGRIRDEQRVSRILRMHVIYTLRMILKGPRAASLLQDLDQPEGLGAASRQRGGASPALYPSAAASTKAIASATMASSAPTSVR